MRILDTVFVYKLNKGEKLAYHGRYHAHGNDEFEVHFFLNGEGSFLSNSAKLAITANSLFLSGPHEFHSILPEQVTRPLTYYAVLFSLSRTEDSELYLLLTSLLQEKPSDGLRLIQTAFCLKKSSDLQDRGAALVFKSQPVFCWKVSCSGGSVMKTPRLPVRQTKN